MEYTFFKECEVEQALSKFVLMNDKLSMGKYTAEFESMFAAWHERKHCIMVNSGSSANLVMVAALMNLGRLKPGDFVGVSAVTWSTNVMPLIQLNLRPVLIDVHHGEINISLDEIKHAEVKLDALFITNVLGVQNDLARIVEYCEKNDIVLLEDNCEALGCITEGRRYGNFGVASSSSSFVGHHLSTIEGGYIFCDDDELAAMCKVVRAHGWTRNLSDSEKRLLKCSDVDEFNAAYTFEYCGFNVRPTDISAYTGILQLPFLDKYNKIRQKRFEYAVDKIGERLFGTEEINPVFALPIKAKCPKQKKKIVQTLTQNDIASRPLVSGSIGLQPFWVKKYGERVTPNSKFIDECGLYVTNDPQLDEDKFEFLIDTLKSACND